MCELGCFLGEAAALRVVGFQHVLYILLCISVVLTNTTSRCSGDENVGQRL